MYIIIIYIYIIIYKYSVHHYCGRIFVLFAIFCRGCFCFGMGKMIKVRGSLRFQGLFLWRGTHGATWTLPHFFGQWLEGLGGISDKRDLVWCWCRVLTNSWESQEIWIPSALIIKHGCKILNRDDFPTFQLSRNGDFPATLTATFRGFFRASHESFMG